jgi:hypothetical protein
VKQAAANRFRNAIKKIPLIRERRILGERALRAAWHPGFGCIRSGVIQNGRNFMNRNNLPCGFAQ